MTHERYQRGIERAAGDAPVPDVRQITQGNAPNIPRRTQIVTTLSAVEWLRQSPNALTIDVELTEAEWFLLVQSIETIHHRYQWYLGDAMVYGIDRKYGETDEQIQRLVDLTGKDDKTLHDYYKTALLFEVSERSDILEFEQHRILARAYSDDTPEHHAERLRWLHIAETQGMSGRKLRAEIAAAQLPAAVDNNLSQTDERNDDRPAPADEMAAPAEMEATPKQRPVTIKKVVDTFESVMRRIRRDNLKSIPIDDLYELQIYFNDLVKQRLKLGE